jgi:hypothetical protein
MRNLPPRERPRRGARGSRWGSALGAACLVAILLTVSLPDSAFAFGCGAVGRPAHSVVPPRQLQGSQKVTPGGDDCTTPGNRLRSEARTRKKGNASGLTVFILAVAAALLIPIGRNGIPRTVDPYGHDRGL